MHHAETNTVRTQGRGSQPITDAVRSVVSESGVEVGLCSVFIHHTSASLVITENADPDVRSDLDGYLSRLVPDGDPHYRHTAEGPDDMSAHIRSALTLTSVTIPVRNGKPDLGTWQGVFVLEHRTSPHQRRITISVVG